MQNDESSKTEDKNIQFYRVTVFLEPLTESLWYEMKQEQQNLPALSEANKVSCSFCLEKFEPASTYAKCLDCEQAEVLICIECLRLGAESHPHTRNHRYTLCDRIGPVLFDEGQNSWGAQEDLQLLNSLMSAHLNQWPELSKDWGKRRTLNEALDHLDRTFIRSEIGQHVLRKYTRGHVREWDERANGGIAPPPTDGLPRIACSSSESHQLQQFAPSRSIAANLVNDNNNIGDMGGTVSKTPSSEEAGEDVKVNENVSADTLKCQKMSPIASTSTSPTHKRINYFDEEENSDGDFGEMGERRMSTRERVPEKGGGELLLSSSNMVENRKIRKEQLLATAKNEAAEALRGKIRKSSLELSEAINLEMNGTNSKKQSKNKKITATSDDLLTDEQLAELYASSAFNPHFYNFPPAPMDSHTVAKFDEEDLQLLTYLPFREEFENEYKNEAEQLISRIIFPREDAEVTAIEEFMNEVRYARFNRYNRLMRVRAVKRATILEHNLLAEYLNIVKTNISEKGKYSVFNERHFASKSKEDAFRPVFFQLRQVAEKETINELARNIGAMETLKEQIDELRGLQRKGVTKLKGRLKMDSAPVHWSKRRKGKNKKAKENTEQRKAGLRWKRIKRWTKRNHLQHNVEEGQDGQQ